MVISLKKDSREEKWLIFRLKLIANESEKIKSVTQAPQVIISSIIKRKDVNADPKIIETNNQLKQICSQRKWKFIDNDRIDDSCLNSSKLHLNKKGSAYLASNFLKKINPNQRNNTTREVIRRITRMDIFHHARNALLAALIVQDLVQNQNRRKILTMLVMQHAYLVILMLLK